MRWVVSAILRARRLEIFQLAHPERHVEAFGDQLDVAVVQHHVDGDVGKLRQEVAQHRREMIHAEIGRDRNAQEPRWRRLHRRHQSIGLAGIVQHPAGAIVIGQANLGGAHPAGGPVQQAGTETGFERGDMFRNGRFRNTHLLRRVREAALVHHRGEGLHFGQTVHVLSFYSHRPNWRIVSPRNRARLWKASDDCAVIAGIGHGIGNGGRRPIAATASATALFSAAGCRRRGQTARDRDGMRMRAAQAPERLPAGSPPPGHSSRCTLRPRNLKSAPT